MTGRHRRGRHRAPWRPPTAAYVAAAVAVGVGAGLPVVALASPPPHHANPATPLSAWVQPTHLDATATRTTQTLVKKNPKPEWDWDEFASVAKQFEDEVQK